MIASDNRRPAGTLEDGVLTLTLRAARGVWHPEGADGPGLTIEAFGEAGSSLTVPAPIIRVKEGTRIVASIANQLDVPLVVHGLCTRDAVRCAPLSVRAGSDLIVPLTPRAFASAAMLFHYRPSRVIGSASEPVEEEHTLGHRGIPVPAATSARKMPQLFRNFSRFRRRASPAYNTRIARFICPGLHPQPRTPFSFRRPDACPSDPQVPPSQGPHAYLADRPSGQAGS